jgi:hypothetical protein
VAVADDLVDGHAVVTDVVEHCQRGVDEVGGGWCEVERFEKQ